MVRNLDPVSEADAQCSLAALCCSARLRKILTTIWCNKLKTSLVTCLGLNRRAFDWLYPPSPESPTGPNRNYYAVSEFPGVAGYVSFTVDDAFCGHDDPEFCAKHAGEELSSTGEDNPEVQRSRSMLPEVRRLCQEFDVKGTWFATSSFCRGQEEDIREFLRDGHELGNHMPRDTPYADYSEQDFEREMLSCNNFLEGKILQGAGLSPEQQSLRWFRAPNGFLSPAMQRVLRKHSMLNAMVDAYAFDTDIPDADFIARNVLAAIQPGSVWLVHMPERGFREWNLRAMRLIMEGLKSRGLKSVTLSELDRRAHSSRPNQSAEHAQPESGAELLAKS